ncbi:multidrug effflux MFS transporter [Jannaschia sp. CCS1]|uniref:multidrug effflux MFS transporter n=1 Tax=Jannaschia sp. (strain CCS1) TaxID=290400 RepID=UPI000053BD10|nr:multidrug effflux MFS transporter [Jannaschia sp. CCS1]ABD54843.1 major facilitator superfamily MFS_1 [Jannaschia sp. CCS1]
MIATPAKTPPRLVTLILLAALSTMTLNMILPSLAAIARTFEAEYAVASLAIGGYLAVTAVVQLVVGPLSDRIGRRPVLLGGLVIFILASVLCMVAQNIWVFLAARMAQSAMSMGYAISLAVVRDTTEPRRAASVIGTIGTIMAIAPILGPVLGGVLDTYLGWRASFVVYALAGLAMLAWCWVDLGETRPERADARPSAVSAARTLLRLPAFRAYLACTALSTGGFFAFLAGVPFVATETFGITTARLGFFIGSITAGYMAGSFISSRLASGLALSTMMLAGRIVACTGLTCGLIALAFGIVTPLTFFGSTICVGMGNGLTMPSSNAGAMSVRPELAGSAAGFTGAATVACGAILTSVAGIIVPGPHAPATVLALMLAASLAALVAALAARRHETTP